MAQEMKYVFWTRALNTEMRIKYEEIFNGSPKSSGEYEKNTDLSNHIIYYSAYNYLQIILFIPRLGNFLRRGEIALGVYAPSDPEQVRVTMIPRHSSKQFTMHRHRVLLFCFYPFVHTQNAIISIQNSLINANYIKGKYVNPTVKLRVLLSYYLSENRWCCLVHSCTEICMVPNAGWSLQRRGFCDQGQCIFTVLNRMLYTRGRHKSGGRGVPSRARSTFKISIGNANDVYFAKTKYQNFIFIWMKYFCFEIKRGWPPWDQCTQS
jgi:hypothetical protein